MSVRVRATGCILLLSIGVGLSVCVADALVDALFFYHQGFLDLLLLSVPRIELYHRVIILGAATVSGILLAYYLDRRRAAEETTKRSEARYRALIENAADMVCCLDAEGELTFLSTPLLEALSYGWEELMGRKASVILAEQDAQSAADAFARAFRGEQVPPHEFRLRRKDGSYLPVEANTNLIYSTDGEPVGLQAILRDVSARRRAEQELRDQGNRAQNYLDIAEVMLLALNADETVALLNQKGCRILGYTQEEVLGRNWFDLCLPESVRDELRRGFHDLLAGKSAPFEYHENPVVTKAGEERLIAWHNTVLTDEAGAVVGTLSSGEDITERRRTEEALQHRVELEQVVASISTQFIKRPLGEMDQVIDDALRRIGEFGGVDRSYVFLFCEDGSTMNNTHEWCAPGIEPQIGSLQDLPSKAFSWWVERLARREVIHIPRVAELPPEAGPEKEVLEAQDIRSCVVVPMFHNESLMGFVGFDVVRTEKTWSEPDIALLRMVGEILSNALHHKRTDELLRRSQEHLAQAQRIAHLGSWAWIVAGDDLQWSQETYRIFGLAPGEFGGSYRAFLETVHPEDRETVERAVTTSLRQRKPLDLEHRIVRPDGSVRVVHERGEVTTDETGTVTRIVGTVLDVTERHRMQEALRAAEAHYRGLVENAVDMIYCLNPRRELTYVSPQLLRALGYTRKELLGAPSDTFIAEEDQSRVRAAFDRRMRGERVPPYQFSLCRKDGTRLPVEIVANPIYSPEGEAVGVQVILRDISERKRVEAELRESEAKYSALVEQAREGVTIIQDGMFAFANRAMSEITGYGRNELVGMPFPRLLPPGTREDVVRIHQARLAGEDTPSLYEFPIIRKDGSTRDLEVSARVISLRGRPAVMAIIRDTTERTRVEVALRQSEERYRDLFENSPVALWEVDFSGSRGFLASLQESGVSDLRAYFETHPEELARCAGLSRVIDVNETSVRMYKAKTKGELLQGLNRVITEASYPALIDFLLAAAEGRNPYSMETVNLTLEGDALEVAVQWSVPPGYEESWSRVLLSVADVSERKRAQGQLLNYQQQLRSLASQLSSTEEREGRRIATYLHDHVGQALALSRIKLGNLRESALPPEVDRTLEEISGFIDQALEDTQSLTFELASPILYELGFEAAVEWLAEQMQEQHSLRTEFHNCPQPKPLQEGVSVVLFQAVRELLVNVVKHARATSVRVGLRRVNHSLRVTVQDDGVGFTTRKGASDIAPGSGFGIFNIRERLSQVGGELEIESQPSRGTRVTLVVPLAPEEETCKDSSADTVEGEPA